jgi:hypothetical protein
MAAQGEAAEPLGCAQRNRGDVVGRLNALIA